ncbi:hypothetical protein [Aureimonas leprariae]|uniref:Uncharacterized protein n=1 Tax=Plantimonas leprariae TaxID=2615207 RepID=A0A7V7TWH4_9HYPH|nr:hypothetical protein [Aureimonas leprariae]KAB0679615.1 hypothetical protein F6X38_12390 [Aureimonas leprariae]
MGGESRVSRENEVFEEAGVPATDGAGELGRPTPADAIPKPADPHATGDDSYPPSEDVDETMAGGLRYPEASKEKGA